jgi:hypothetical protein
MRREEPPVYPHNVSSRYGVGTTRSDDHGNDDALYPHHLLADNIVYIQTLARTPGILEDARCDS